jgi:prepilin-type N-terminal cleavage/methylation domain-containing protein
MTDAPRRARILKGTRGFTLTELLVATAICLSTMAGVAQLFSLYSRTVSQTQALVALQERLRAVSTQLRRDLKGVTTDLSAKPNRADSDGYFELIEGPDADTYFITAAGAVSLPGPGQPPVSFPQSPVEAGGDTDDCLLFTAAAVGEPFVGRFMGAGGVPRLLESDYAELAWFCKVAAVQPFPGVTVHTLYRRQLLVTGYVGDEPFLSGTNQLPLTTNLADYDLSLRNEGVYVPNTLGDLARRPNRFEHTAAYPHWFNSTDAELGSKASPGRAGEDVVLTNVIAFDVRVFDPDAPVLVSGTSAGTGVPIYPGDAVIRSGTAVAFDRLLADKHAFQTSIRGAYVDLYWSRFESMTGRDYIVSGNEQPWPFATPLPPPNPPFGVTAFSGLGVQIRNNAPVSFNSPGKGAVYDTFSTFDETNGLDDDGDGLVDEGTDLLDNDNDGMTDEDDEKETSPPYPVRLRGIEVRIRCFEPVTRGIRQVTIRHTFPER